MLEPQGHVMWYGFAGTCPVIVTLYCGTVMTVPYVGDVP